MSSDRSYLITDLTPAEVRGHLAVDRRLIIPIGACDQYGPHLPIGSCTLIAEAFCEDLSTSCGVLRAPTIQYGVNVPTAASFAGPASLREKTLHAMMNDILACWQDQGFEEFIVLTAHGYDAHAEAIATATVAGSRVRMVELLNMDLSQVTAAPAGSEHGGEVITSLMLHLYPERVDFARAVDFEVRHRGGPPRRIECVPVEAPGSVGRPTSASADKGKRLYGLIRERLIERVLNAGPEDDAGAR